MLISHPQRAEISYFKLEQSIVLDDISIVYATAIL